MAHVAAAVALLLASAAPAGGTEPALWEAAGVSRIAPPVEAPAFALPDLEGRRTDLAAFRGRVVLLYFWTTW